ncbi:MAG TPA: type I DNA topoisomerase [bacterium]|nr:type I DNA topoisomerase [bacterium]
MPKKNANAPKRAKAGRKVGVLPPRHQDTKARTKSEARGEKLEARSRGTGKDLLIVESPTKARTIGKLLAGKMQVLSSRGHIADLPKSRLGVDIEHGFEPDYIKIRGKAAVINELKAAARQARAVYIATDPDREGEAIAYSVAFELGGARGEGQGTAVPMKRVLVYEITAKGLKEALDKPIEIDQRKVDSHRGRRVLDRLVGYLVSPLLWKIVRGGLSAGRVQTVALRMIVDREREIQAFKPEEFWTIKALFEKEGDKGIEGARDRVEEREGGGATFEAQLAKIAGKDFKITSAAEMEAVKKGCAAAEFRVADVRSRDRARRPLPPFATATMQQDAVQRLSMPARRAMQVAQQLFEGIDLEKETAGLITYPRTDSFRVADAFVGDTREFVAASFGPEFLPEKPRHYPDRAGAQGAHEAIRPTRVDRTPESVKRFLTPEQFRLYDLVWRRFVASQMADAVYALTEAQVAGGDYLFKADAVKCKFSGFERVYGDPDKEKVLPALAPAEPLTMKEFRPEQKFTQPPARYTEATLIKRLETNSIGRPSTYATIVSTLFDRKYAERREGRLWPTELGMVVTDVLVPRFSDIFELGFTREMEKELDLVEEGSEKWQEVIGRFYKPFKQDLDKVAEGAADIKQELRKELEEKCPECGANLAERWGRFGKFIACSRYPECKYIKKEKAKLLDEKCPQCGKPLAERSGRFGPFKACSGYPECRYIKREEPGPNLKPGEPCPKCGKPLAEKRGRFGVFVGCTGYPECKFMVRGARPEPKMLEEKCPQCGKNLVERRGRFGPFVACSGYPKCKYIKKDKKPGTGDQGSGTREES